MPFPDSTLSTLRPDLAASMEEFNLAEDRMGFIGHQVLPVTEVAKQSGNFGKIPVEQLLQERDTNRAPGAGYSRGKWEFTPATYACEEHGAEEPVDDREAQMYAEYFDAELVSAQRAMDAVLRNAEKRIADAVFNTTTFTANTLTNEWDDNVNATPVADILTAKKAAWDASGLWANTLIINRKVFMNLRNCDEVQDIIASSGAGSSIAAGDITVAQLAQAFDLEKILVAGSARNSADKGQAASIAPIWSDEYAMVCRTATTNDFREPCIGRTFHWSEDGSQVGGTIETYREEQTRSNIVRVRHDVDELILHSDCAYLFDNVTT